MQARKAAGVESPRSTAREVMRGIRRTVHAAQRQVAPVLVPEPGGVAPG